MGSASSVDVVPDSPAASALGLTNVLFEVRSDEETSSGSTSSSSSCLRAFEPVYSEKP